MRQQTTQEEWQEVEREAVKFLDACRKHHPMIRVLLWIAACLYAARDRLNQRIAEKGVQS